MKIKENTLNVPLKILAFIFTTGAIAATAVRTLQMFKYIDHETGFNQNSDAIGIFFYFIIAYNVLAYTFFSYLGKASSKIETTGKNNVFVAVSSTAFSLSLLFDSVNSFAKSVTVTVSSTGNLFKDMMISGSLPLMMQSLFAVLSAVYFIIFAKDYFKGTQKASNRKVLCLAPLGWVAFRLIHCFVRQISFIKVSDLFSELIMLSFMIMFFMALAQVTSSVYSDGFRWRILAFGYSASIIAVSLSVSRFIYSFVNGSDALNADHPFNITDLIFAFFAVSLIVAVTKQADKNVQNENASEKKCDD